MLRLALLPLLLAANTVLGAALSAPDMSLLVRQTGITSTPTCSAACNALENVVQGSDTGASALCSSTVVNDYATCYNCIVQAGAVSAADAQTAVNGYVSGCAALGFPVGDIKINGDSGSSSRVTGGTTTARGASSPTSSGTAARASVTPVCADCNGSSSSSSGSSSSNGDSGSSGSGGSLGSGGGFKTGGSIRLSATPAMLLVVLSVAVFRHL